MLYEILLGEDTVEKIYNFIKNKFRSIITMETITTKKRQKSFKSLPRIGKIIFSSLILLAVIMASGCIDLDEILGGGGKEPPEEHCDSKHLSLCDNENNCENVGGYWYNNQCNEEEEMSGYDDPTVDDSDKEFIKNIESFDLENDGSADKYVYKYEREEVDENLFLDKCIEFNKVDSGLNGKIILKFENTGDKAVEYSHIEVIPKSFAKSVDDLEFSRPPDEIIDADPVLKYDIKTRDNKVEVIEIKSKRTLGIEWGRMDVATLTKMSCEEKFKWINMQIGPYKDTIKKTAEKHNIPPRLLATVILNELGDYDLKDQLQEVIPCKGSVGMAQITIPTAIKHGLVDVSDEEIRKHANSDGHGTYISSDVPVPTEAPSFDHFDQLLLWNAKEYLTWKRLNQPELAIEAAAREIEFILDNTNKNLDKPWAKSLLTGPIDRSDLYKNLKHPEGLNFPDPYQMRIEKEGTLAVLVVGPYNSEKILSGKFDLKNPYVHPNSENRKVPYFSARTHAASARAEFTEMLAKQHMFEDGEYTEISDICCGHVNENCCPNDKCYTQVADTGLMCESGKCVNCGVINEPCCPNDKCGLRTGEDNWRIICKDGKCVKKEEEKKEDTSTGEFNCPVPAGAKDISSRSEGFYVDCWIMPNSIPRCSIYSTPMVGPYQSWYDEEKTKRASLRCYNVESKLQGAYKAWYRDGTLWYEHNYKDGKLQGVQRWYEQDGTLRECIYENNNRVGECKYY